LPSRARAASSHDLRQLSKSARRCRRCGEYAGSHVAQRSGVSQEEPTDPQFGGTDPGIPAIPTARQGADGQHSQGHQNYATHEPLPSPDVREPKTRHVVPPRNIAGTCRFERRLPSPAAQSAIRWNPPSTWRAFFQRTFMGTRARPRCYSASQPRISSAIGDRCTEARRVPLNAGGFSPGIQSVPFLLRRSNQNASAGWNTLRPGGLVCEGIDKPGRSRWTSAEDIAATIVDARISATSRKGGNRAVTAGEASRTSTARITSSKAVFARPRATTDRDRQAAWIPRIAACPAAAGAVLMKTRGQQEQWAAWAGARLLPAKPGRDGRARLWR
jgi:hypothetical protein